MREHDAVDAGWSEFMASIRVRISEGLKEATTLDELAARRSGRRGVAYGAWW